MLYLLLTLLTLLISEHYFVASDYKILSAYKLVFTIISTYNPTGLFNILGF